ncbi:MAG: hypothetical protein O2954_16640, partial [bacterium]|nr:hypothetical protein [bacterium]
MAHEPESYDVQFANPVEWTRKTFVFHNGGPDGLYVVSDWDRTLTRSRSRDNKDQSTYSLIFNGNYLPPEYNRQSSALFNTYRSSENSTELPEDRKSALMTEWWTR